MANIDKLFDIDISSGVKLWDETINTFYSLVMDLDVVSPSLLQKGVIAGGLIAASTGTNVIDYITINSPGNAADHGDLTAACRTGDGASNGPNDRAIYYQGYDTGGRTNNIDYFTISTNGNASDFGNQTDQRYSLGSTSNTANERMVTGGGYTSNYSNIIDYVTINSPGNATDFGDRTFAGRYLPAISNSTNERGCFNGGYDGSRYNIIDYVTINSAGNATDFGDLLSAVNAAAGCDNGTGERGIVSGGATNTVNPQDVIQYYTINSTGNASDFGDLVLGVLKNHCGTSNATDNIGIFFGGWDGSTHYLNYIQYITINSPGNSTDFGDLTIGRQDMGAMSNS